MRNLFLLISALFLAACAGAPAAPSATAPTTTYSAGGTVGGRVVYVIDRGSNANGHFNALGAEVRRSVSKMAPTQRAAVTFFGATTECFPADGALTAMSPQRKEELFLWLDTVAPSPEPSSMESAAAAIEKACAAKPQLIYLICCGPVDPALPARLRTLNADRKIKIYTVGFVRISHASEDLLKAIAREHGGRYKFVGEKDLVVDVSARGI